MRKGTEPNFKGSSAISEAGALIGPWNPWLQFPKFGRPIWELVKVLSASPTLPRPVREVAIQIGISEAGALIVPWNPWLQFPKFGRPIWELVKVLSASPTLPRPVREVAI